jgi:hypothetical protein
MRQIFTTIFYDCGLPQNSREKKNCYSQHHDGVVPPESVLISFIHYSPSESGTTQALFFFFFTSTKQFDVKLRAFFISCLPLVIILTSKCDAMFPKKGIHSLHVGAW